MAQLPHDPLGNSVAMNENGVIVLTMMGRQTPERIKALNKEFTAHATALREQNKKVLALVDIQSQKLTDSSSEVRLEGKHMLSDLSVDACAILGKSVVASMALYALRAAGVGKNIRFFTSKRKAHKWLETMRATKPKPLRLGPFAGVVMMLIGFSVLLGWQINNATLTCWLPSLRPMNPLSAIGIIVIGFGFVTYWAKKWRWLRWGGGLTILLGVAALLPLHIDYLLYGGRLTASGAPVEVANSAAICFIAMGSVALLAGRKGRRIEILEYGATFIISGLAAFNIFGQLYARSFLYSLGDFVMAWNLAVAFLVCGIALLFLVVYRQFGKNVLQQISRTGWLVVLALLVVQIATYTTWQQAVNRNRMETTQALRIRTEDIRSVVASHLQAYTNSLRGFGGLFAASDYVSPSDFSTYYQSLNLAQNYPGLQSVIFVAAVNDADLPAFVKQIRQDGVTSNGKPFTITSKTSASKHFILMYTSTGSSTSIGLDLTSIPGRTDVYNSALASRDIYGSGTVTVGVNTPTPYQGFFLTTQVATATSAQPIGVVNAVLNYKLFFSHLFDDNNLLKDIDVTIVDTTNDKKVFSSVKDNDQDSYIAKRTLQIANRTWQLTIHTDKTFGVSDGQVRFPALTILVGQLFSVFLLLLFIILWRSRQQALDLADAITADLQVERNKAVANDRKSTAILASIGDGVFAIDTHRRLTLLNPVAQTISGISEQEAIGKPYGDVLRFELEKNGHISSRFIDRALDGHLSSMEDHTVLVRSDGKRIAVADSAAPIRDSHNTIIGAIIVFRDISKEYELDKAKNEFVSLASHQLRTPLSAINWYGEMLLSGDAGKLNKSQHEYVGEIFDGSQRMVELVNALLDVSRLEVGKLHNEPAPNDAKELTESLEKELAVSIQTKNLRITKDLATLPAVVADPKQLRMVFQNLMSNAVKYTPAKGSVDITLKRADKKTVSSFKLPATESYWLFSVADSGYGIPKEDQPRIFSKMFRADNVRKMDVEGTGLGLYIVKEVVEKMGGKVWFESMESVGTTFYVVLPFKARHGK